MVLGGVVTVNATAAAEPPCFFPNDEQARKDGDCQDIIHDDRRRCEQPEGGEWHEWAHCRRNEGNARRERSREHRAGCTAVAVVHAANELVWVITNPFLCELGVAFAEVLGLDPRVVEHKEIVCI